MTPRITTTGRDSFTPPAAMTGARRYEIYGPVQSAEDEPAIGFWSYAGMVFIGMLVALAVIG